MPTWEDFDTVCYSNQHNIIQIIKFLVQMGETLEALQGQVGAMNGLMNDMFELQGDMFNTMQTMGDTISTMAGLIAIHEQRITNLENGG